MDMKLFESLDEKVFTDELKASLTEQFDSAVEAKAIEISEVKAIEIVADKIEEKIIELEEKAEEYNAILDQESADKSAELLDQVDAYLEKVVEEFVTEAKESLEESIKQEKADMIIEAMDAMIVATGVDIAKIVESKDSSDADAQLEASIKKYDALVDENIDLEKENATLMKMGIIAELKEGMTTVEAEKFTKFAELVEYDKSASYVSKLEVIKESVGTIKEKPKKVTEEVITENVKDVKDVKTSITTSFSHLI